MQLKPLLFFLLIPLFFMSCSKRKFDSNQWKKAYGVEDGPGDKEKEEMAEDLVASRKLIGLDRKQMIDLLGEPANDPTSTWYTLEENYDMIDPVSGSYLHIYFNKDSIITKAAIINWHKH